MTIFLAALLLLQVLAFGSVTEVSPPAEAVFSEEVGEEDEGESTVPYSFEWMLTGEFLDADTPTQNATLSAFDIPDDVIIPPLRWTQSDNWSFEDSFDNGIDPDWECGSDGIIWRQGGSMRLQISSGGVRNAWCNAISDIDPESRWTTFAQQMWVVDPSNHSWRGGKIGGNALGRPVYFQLIETTAGNTAPVQEFERQGMACGTQRTPTPAGTDAAIFHEYRAIADHEEEQAYLYQGPFLRCRQALLPSGEVDDRLALNVYGGDGDDGVYEYDDIRFGSGAWKPFTNGTWLSPPLVKDADYQWGTLTPSWQMFGVGNFPDDVVPGIRLTIVHAETLSPVEGYERLIPAAGGLNLSEIHHSFDLRLLVEWEDAMVDLIGLDGLAYTSGEMRPPEIWMESISVQNEPLRQNRTSPKLLVTWGYARVPEDTDWECEIRVFGVVVVNGTLPISAGDGQGEYLRLMSKSNVSGELNISFRFMPAENEENVADNEASISVLLHPLERPSIANTYVIEDYGYLFHITLEPQVDGKNITNWWITWEDAPGSPTVEVQSGLTASHLFESPGYKRVTIGAEMEGGFQSLSTTKALNVVNAPPIPSLSHTVPWPELPELNHFSCADSTDGTPEFLRCDWFIDDHPVAAGEEIYTSLEKGSHFIEVQVTDIFGLSAKTNLTVEVNASESPGPGLLEAVEFENGNSADENGTIRVRPILDPDVSLDGTENLTFHWMGHGVNSTVTHDLDTWAEVPVGLEAGLFERGVVLTVETENSRSYHHLMYTVEAIEIPPIADFEFNTSWDLDAVPIDLRLHIDTKKSQVSPWELRTIGVKFEKGDYTRGPWYGYKDDWYFTPGASGVWNVTVTVSDGGAESASITKSFTVENPPPYIRTLECSLSPDAEKFLCSVLAFDEEVWPEDLRYEWRVDNRYIEGGPEIVLDNVWGEVTVTVRVSDPHGAYDERTVTEEIPPQLFVREQMSNWGGWGALLLGTVTVLAIAVGITNRIRDSRVDLDAVGVAWAKDNPWEESVDQTEALASEDSNETAK